MGVIGNFRDIEEDWQFDGIITVHQIGDKDIEHFLRHVGIFHDWGDASVILVEQQI